MTKTKPKYKLKLRTSKIAPKFRSAFAKFWRYMVFVGGRGGSKSTHIAILLLARMLVDEYMYLVYCRKWSAHIKDSQFKLFQDVAKMMGWENEFKFNNGDYSFVCLRNGNRAIAKGLDDPDKTKSLAEPTHIWVEEADQITFEDFDTLNKSLRSPKTQNSFILSFNTFIDELHWIRKTIFDQEQVYELSDQFKEIAYLNHSTYLDNPFIDQEEYKATLLMDNGGNYAKIQSDLEGVWGEEPNDMPWLYAFDEERHVSDFVPFLPTYPIYLTFDFNKDPLTCSIWQMSPQMGKPDSFIQCIEEFSEPILLREMCTKIKTKYPFSLIFVTGDSSGNREGDVGFESQHDSIYSLIRKYLGLSENQVNPNTSNIWYENSRILMNAMFYNYPSIKIHSGCKKLISDIKIAKPNEKGKPHELLKDRGKYAMDLFDGMRYFFQRYFQEFARSNYHNIQTKSRLEP